MSHGQERFTAHKAGSKAHSVKHSMTTNKISIIFGTRPEAVKLAPVILQLKKIKEVDCQVCVTAQHREMFDQVLDVFKIVPDVDLDLMKKNQTLADFTARAITALDRYMASHEPDLILVQGDTTTVFCAALVAFYHRIPVGHVEAGLRKGDIYSPWPEEINRLLATCLTTLHFTPTKLNRENLLKEDVNNEQIYITGNTVIDALFIAREKVKNIPPPIPGILSETFMSWNGKPVILITGHRRENFGEGFENICNAIAELAKRFPETQFIYPVQLNPNVRKPVERILGVMNHSKANIHLIKPLAYFPFVTLMDRAHIILTDSGGVQEEAPGLGKPVLVMRNTTERPEGVEAGTVKLVGTDYNAIVDETSRLMTDTEAYNRMSHAHNPYGDGMASERIINIILRYFGFQVSEMEMWQS